MSHRESQGVARSCNYCDLKKCFHMITFIEFQTKTLITEMRLSRAIIKLLSQGAAKLVAIKLQSKAQTLLLLRRSKGKEVVNSGFH